MFFAFVLRSAALAALAYRAVSHKSLTLLGVAAALATGFIHSLTSSSMSIVLIFTFFLTSTKFTKMKAELKKSLTVLVSDKKSPKGDESRNHIQVLCNSIIASVLILLRLISPRSWHGLRDVLEVGILANYAAVTADTWSSELGILSTANPILITTLRPCPKGTNGGVSPLGLGVALGGGALMGLVGATLGDLSTGWTVVQRLRFVVFAAGLGLFGSVLDSLLGALFQKSIANTDGKILEADGGYKLDEKKLGAGVHLVSGQDILSNNEVNLSMAAGTSLVGMLLWALS